MTSSVRITLSTTLLILMLAGALGVIAPVSVIVAAAALSILSLLAAVSPVGALMAVVISLPYFYRPIAVGTMEFAASELILVAAVAGATLRLAIDLRRGASNQAEFLELVTRILQSRLVLALVILALAGAATLFTLYDPSARGASLREWRWSLFEPLVFLGLLIGFGRSRTSRILLAGSLIAAGAIASAHGLLDVVSGGGVTADNVRRLSGPLPHPNALALFLVKAFVLGATLIVIAPRWRPILILPVALTGFALFGTFSRGAMLAVAFAVLMVAIRSRRVVQIALGTGTVTAGILAFLVAGDRMSNALEGGSVSLRLDIWRSAIAMIRDSPIFGYGPDQFLYAYAPRYIQPTAWDERFTSHAHNIVADSWIRLGLVGAVVAIVVLLVVARRLAKRVHFRDGVFTIQHAALIALAATIVHGLIDNAYFGHDLAMSAWLIGWLAFDEPMSDGGGTGGSG